MRIKSLLSSYDLDMLRKARAILEKGVNMSKLMTAEQVGLQLNSLIGLGNEGQQLQFFSCLSQMEDGRYEFLMIDPAGIDNADKEPDYSNAEKFKVIVKIEQI